MAQSVMTLLAEKDLDAYWNEVVFDATDELAYPFSKHAHYECFYCYVSSTTWEGSDSFCLLCFCKNVAILINS